MFEFEEEPSRWESIKGSNVFLPLIILIGSAEVAAVLLVNKPEVEEEENEFPPVSVRVEAASLEEKLRSSVFQGEVRAKTDIQLVTQVTGKVISVSDDFIEGGQFDANDVVLQIDDADFRVALKSAEASVAEAQVQLDIELASAENNKKEWRDLYGDSLENADPLRLNQPQVQRARARLDASRAQLDQARLDLERTKIRAPFAGRVMRKSAELGQFISRGSGVGRMFSTDSVEIRIPMSDLQISELGLRLGQIQDQTKKIPARVSTQFGNTQYEWAGYLKSVDASVDTETRLLFGTIVVDNPFPANDESGIPLAPGLFVDVELKAAEKIAGVSVPRTALRSGNRVYIVQDNALKYREVETIFTSPQIAVLSVQGDNSVQAGDLVITSPVPGAYDGMKIEITKSEQANISAQPQEANDDEKQLSSEPQGSEGVAPTEQPASEPVQEEAADTATPAVIESESSSSAAADAALGTS